MRLSACLAIGLAVLAMPVQALDYLVEDKVLFLEGEIVTRDLAKMTRVIQRNPQLETVVLLDVPGSNDDETNSQIIRLFRGAGLNTHLLSDSFVASGGTDLFLAGVQRTMEHGAEVGVHSWWDGQREGVDYPRTHPEHQLFLDLYAYLGISQDFYWFTLDAAPADGMHFMSEAEILRYGLVTAPIMKGI